MRVGFGYDIHPLTKGRKLVLGGTEIPSPLGEEGHSDGDVLIHAVIDALLGASSMGDIGRHFPPGDPAYRGISSRILLQEISRLLEEHEFQICNIDSTVILERPKILNYIRDIQCLLAEDLGIAPDQISVKGKTKEGLDAAGVGEAVEAYAVALIEKIR